MDKIKKPKKILGKKREATSESNCGLCQKYMNCKDKDKSLFYKCSLFDSGKIRHRVMSTSKPKASKFREIPDIKVEDFSEKSYKHFSTQMDRILAQLESNPIPPDLIVDDRDFPQASNFFEWITDRKFLGLDITPFAKQLQVGTNMFSEFCPHCSNKKYFSTDMGKLHLEVPVRMSTDKFLENVELLKFGKCPKCKGTKSEFYRAKELPVYTALTGVAGQRASKCVIGSTLVHTTKGFETMESIVGRQNEGTQPFEGRQKIIDWDGKDYKIVNTYVSENDYVREITLSNGQQVTGKDTHPLYVWEKGFVPIVELRVGNTIPIYLGQNVWPKISNIGSSAAVCLAILKGKPELVHNGISLIKKPDYYDVLVKNILHFVNESYFVGEHSQFDRDGIVGNHQHITMTQKYIQNLTALDEEGVPSCILTASKARVSDYLSTYFTLSASSFSQGLSITANKLFLSHVQILLHNFGIPCQIMSENLIITGKYALDMFFEHIGLISSTVEERLKTKISKQLGGLNEAMPFPAWYDWVMPNVLTKYADKIGKFENTTLRSKVAKACVKYLKEVDQDKEIEILLEYMLDSTLAFTYISSRQKSDTKVKTFDITVDEVSQFMGNGLLNHNSTTFSMMVSYQTHGFMKLQNPSSYYNQMPNQVLHGQLTALTWQAAIELLWVPIMSMMQDSPWYKGYHELLDDVGYRNGEELYKLKDTFYENRARRLRITPLGPDRKKLRGRTNYLSGVDELGLFDSSEDNKKVKMNADEVYQSLRNSLRSLVTEYFNKIKSGDSFILPPIIGAISSPLDKKDKIIRLWEESPNDKTMYAFKYPTWKFNPHQPRSAFDTDFALNPLRAMRDFGAEPPNSSMPFIEDLSKIKSSIGDDSCIMLCKPRIARIKPKNGAISEFWTADPKPLIPRDQVKRAMALDAGQTNNSFSISIGHYDNNLHRPVIDSVCELIPKNGIRINHALLYDDFIRPIVSYFNVGLVVADRWQSTKVLDEIAIDEACLSETYSVKYDDFKTFKNDLEIGAVTLPANELDFDKIERAGLKEYPLGFFNYPVSHLLYQLVTVQDTGFSVDKGVGSTDDNLRSIVLLYSYLIDPKYRNFCSGSVMSKAKLQGFLSSSGSRGGSGGGGGSSSSSSPDGSSRFSFSIGPRQ